MFVEVTLSILGKVSQPLWHFSLNFRFLFGFLSLTASVIVTARPPSVGQGGLWSSSV